ncbi:hypothetical protein COR50_16925 [Chitinophaga caeni]|uniref:DUF481 domain-containing protein n=1 Tax=Chitinophaga caeni TaxID=2029983 RepID=A0A291QXF3_9BACT|nr:DUF481 domain-containing protein [Chitinophaga caeni]ATL48709.1 hypothetical protein COR50_16925 [Chitinophaga caeni]
MFFTLTKRKLTLFGILLFLLSSWSSSLSAQTDKLYLRNGTILNGTLRSINLGKINFDANDIGIVDVKITNARTLFATSFQYRVSTVHQDVMYGSILPGKDSGSIIFASGKDSVNVLLDDIVTLSKYRKGIMHQIEGNISAGYSFTKSSELGRINLDASLNTRSKNVALAFTGATITSIQGDSLARDLENASLQVSYYYLPDWYLLTYVNYQRNLSLGIGQRFQEALGTGYEFLKRSRMLASVGTGGILNQEKSLEGDRNYTFEIPLLLQYDLFLFSSPNLSFSFKQQLYFGISQKGRIREDGETRLSYEVISDLTISLVFYNNYDNQPPAGSVRNFDYNMVVNVGYKF